MKKNLQSALWAFLCLLVVCGFMETHYKKILKSTAIADITASQLPWRPSKVFVPFAKEYFYRGAYWHLIASPRQRCFNKRTQLRWILNRQLGGWLAAIASMICCDGITTGETCRWTEFARVPWKSQMVTPLPRWFMNLVIAFQSHPKAFPLNWVHLEPDHTDAPSPDCFFWHQRTNFCFWPNFCCFWFPRRMKGAWMICYFIRPFQSN